MIGGQKIVRNSFRTQNHHFGHFVEATLKLVDLLRKNICQIWFSFEPSENKLACF
jgi:hypothetical protein